MSLRSVLSGLVPRRIFAYLSQRFPDEASSLSYAQEGEDLVLAKMFAYTRNGFFVDVGAHHPKMYSNTYLLYRRGWRGINIDAMPGSMPQFRRLRPRDISLEIPISAKRQHLTYYMYNIPAFNTMSKEVHDKRVRESDRTTPSLRLIDTRDLYTRTLADVLDEHLPADYRDSGIDFLSVDVEGLDLDVLQSNDWSKYRPRAVVAEILESDVQSALSSPISAFMFERGYVMKSKCFNSVIYVRE